MGIAYNDCGDFTKSLEYNQKALSIRNEQEPLDYLDIAESYNNIGIVYNNQGNYEKALEYYNKALNIYIKVLGLEHPDIATSFNNIGSYLTYVFSMPTILETSFIPSIILLLSITLGSISFL